MAKNPSDSNVHRISAKKIKFCGILDRLIAQQILDSVNVTWNRRVFLTITGKMVLWKWKLQGYRKWQNNKNK